MQDKKPKPKPGPEPERLKLEGHWEDAAERMLEKKRPPEGWPDHHDEDTEPRPRKTAQPDVEDEHDERL